MRKWVVKFLSVFIPVQKLRKKFRDRYIKSPLRTNWKKIQKNNEIKIHKEDKKYCAISVEGKNNQIDIGKLVCSKESEIHLTIYGNNNKIVVKDGVGIGQELYIQCGQKAANYAPIENAEIMIGEKTTFEKVYMTLYNSHSKLSIGKNCMISYGVNIYHTDGHPIYDAKTRKLVNKVKELSIGDHVWIGANATLLKNTKVAEDCMIGWQSVVSGDFSEPQCAIAGNPAKVVKKGVTWDSDGSRGYIQNEF